MSSFIKGWNKERSIGNPERVKQKISNNQGQYTQQNAKYTENKRGLN